MANQFLIKNTMQGMKTLDSTEIAELQSGICRCSIIGLS